MRIETDLLEAAHELAQEARKSLSAVIREALLDLTRGARPRLQRGGGGAGRSR